MGAGTEKGISNLGYGYTILVEGGFYFSKKSNPSFIMTKQRDCNRPFQILSFLYLQMCMSSLVLMVDLDKSNSIFLRVFVGLT